MLEYMKSTLESLLQQLGILVAARFNVQITYLYLEQELLARSLKNSAICYMILQCRLPRFHTNPLKIQ